jgi:hypothetical protein
MYAVRLMQARSDGGRQAELKEGIARRSYQGRRSEYVTDDYAASSFTKKRENKKANLERKGRTSRSVEHRDRGRG